MKILVKKAKASDAQEIKALVEPYAEEGIMLPRPIYEIYENIRDFSVAVIDGKVVGCCAIHIFGKEYKLSKKKEEMILAEIRTLVVARPWQRRKIGKRLVESCIKEGRALGITKIFVLTIKENLDFFKKLCFETAPKMKLPQKIWQECIRCPRFPAECNEIPLILNIQP